MYNTFITQVIENKVVYHLKKNKEQAVCSSNVFFIEETDESLPVFPFWSDKTMAEKCRKEEWLSYQVTEIPIVEFMEFWCLGMFEDGVVAGINFDENLYGNEEIPTKLLQDLLTQAEKTNTSLAFKNFKTIKDFKKYLETNEFDL